MFFFATVRRGRIHLLTFPSPSGVSPPSGGTSRPNCSAPLRGGSSSGAVPGWPQVGHLLPVLVFCSPSPPVSRSASHPTAATKCEGPDGHPTLFGDVATGLGGEVWKNRTRDGGCHKIYIYTHIYLQRAPAARDMCPNIQHTHTGRTGLGRTGIAVLCTLGTCLS